jgi:hypothetical protein
MTEAERRGAPGPIEAATQDLMAWLSEATGQAPRLAPPSDATDGGLWLWPLELRTQRQTRGMGTAREPFRFGVRYLLTASGPQALRLLDRVLTAATRAGEPEISLEAGDPALWQALKVAPRPALFIETPALIETPAISAPPVLQPLQVTIIPRVTLSGRVVGPNDVPLAAMRVEVLGTPLKTETDAQGRFTMAGVPEATEVRLRLVGRGRVLTAEVDPTDADLVIKCDLPVR